MGVFTRSAAKADEISPTTSSPETTPDGEKHNIEAHHGESMPANNPSSKFKLNKAGDGDVALALFSSPTDIREPIDPIEEKKLVRKIDLMILPYLAGTFP